jgi:hypothetical protein
MGKDAKVILLIGMLLMSLISPAFSYTFCIDNTTLREITVSQTQDGNETIDVTKTKDYPCILTCTNSTNPPSCIPSSDMNIWFFIMITIFCFFMMFLPVSTIVNMIGSLLLMIAGGYVLVFGIDFTGTLPLVGTASSFTINNTITYVIGFIFIGLALFRLAVSWSKMQE